VAGELDGAWWEEVNNTLVAHRVDVPLILVFGLEALTLCVFTGFHFYLVSKGETSYEHARKSKLENPGINPYDRGCLGNMLTILNRTPGHLK